MELKIVQFIALFFLVLVTGVFWGPWLSLHRNNQVLSSTEFVRIVKIMVGNLAMPMRILMPACIAFLALATWFYPQINSIGFYFSLAALVLSIVALVITLLVEVPIVKQISRWTDITMPTNWQAIRDRWKFYHVIRIICSLSSFASFAISLFY